MANNQAKKSILIFSTAYLPLIGGAEVTVKEITQRLPDWQFDMITAKIQSGLAKFERIGNINIYRVGLGWRLDKYFFPWLAYFKARKLHQGKNYQVVQAIMAFYAGLAALFFKWKYPQVKYLLTMQSGDSDFFIWLRTWFWYPLYKKIYTKADYIQAISQFLVKRARRYGYRGDIEIVPNGVDLDKFQTSHKSQIINHKVIITVSRLVKKNGLDDLIKAIAQLDVKLLILGKGPDENKLKKLVKDLKIEDKVIFMGHVQYNDLPKYYSMANVFVRPSLSEGLGNVFLEAMACGVPVIGTPVGGIPDFLKDRETGLFCQVRNPQNIAERVKELLSNDGLRRIIISNGQKLVKEKYSWSKISQQMEQIFQKLS